MVYLLAIPRDHPHFRRAVILLALLAALSWLWGRSGSGRHESGGVQHYIQAERYWGTFTYLTQVKVSEDGGHTWRHEMRWGGDELFLTIVGSLFFVVVAIVVEVIWRNRTPPPWARPKDLGG